MVTLRPRITCRVFWEWYGFTEAAFVDGLVNYVAVTMHRHLHVRRVT